MLRLLRLSLLCAVTLLTLQLTLGAPEERVKRGVAFHATDNGEQVELGPKYTSNMGWGAENRRPRKSGRLRRLFEALKDVDPAAVIQGQLQVISGQGGHPHRNLQGWYKTYIEDLRERGGAVARAARNLF